MEHGADSQAAGARADPPSRDSGPGIDQRASRAWTRFPVVFLSLVAIACVVVYLPVRNAPFVFDDIVNIVENPHVRMTSFDPASLARALVPHENRNLRPLSFLTFAFNHLHGGYEPFGYHVVNLAVLLLSLPVAYLLALRLGGAWLQPQEARALALGTTALWALHPLLTNGVSYVVQRMTALYALFSLSALHFFLRARLSGRPAPYALAGLSLLLAFASKETALITPLLAVLALWLLPREAGGSGSRTGWVLAALVAGSQAVMLPVAQYALRFKWTPAQPFGFGERLLTEGRVVLRYLELFILPSPQELAIDYTFPLSTSLLAPPSTLAAAALHAALIAAAIWLRRRRPLLAFGILGFYLLQLPEGTFMPLDLIFEHRAYFPAYFLALALMDALLWALGRLRARHAARGALAVAVALAALWGGFGYRRNQVWADPVTLWEDTVAKAPGSTRAQGNLGAAYLEAGDPRRAVGHLEESVRISPGHVRALSNLGRAYVDLGNAEKAVGYLQEAIRIRPEFPEAHSNLGKAYMQLGNTAQAIASLQEAVRLKPEYPEALNNLGRACALDGKPEKALGYLREAVRLRPEFPEALNNLASVHGMLGQFEESLEYSRKAIAAKPNYAAARYNLGVTLLRLGRDAEATAAWRTLQELDPALAQRLRRQMAGAGD